MIALVVVAVIFIAALVWFVGREISKTQNFFTSLAARFEGATTRLPFGVTFKLDRIPIRIYALQGSLQYRAKVRLREDPGIIVTRTYDKFRFLNALNYSPTRQKYSFHAPIDRQYGFWAKDTRWMREIFDQHLLESLTTKGRITRLDISDRGVKGALLMLTQSNKEAELAKQSIDILNEVVTRLKQSTLAVDRF